MAEYKSVSFVLSSQSSHDRILVCYNLDSSDVLGRMFAGVSVVSVKRGCACTFCPAGISDVLALIVGSFVLTLNSPSLLKKRPISGDCRLTCRRSS